MYDEETSLYYLQSRYYDPEVGRFISADVLLSTGQGVLGHDAYAYCLGNPVNMEDSSGSIAWQVDLTDDPTSFGFIGIIIGAAVSYAVISRANSRNTTNVWAGLSHAMGAFAKTIEGLFVREETTDIAVDATSDNPPRTPGAVFYGAVIQNDLLEYVKGPMNEEAALQWARDQKYYRRTSWGVWTQHQSDAEHFLQMLIGLELTESFVLDMANQKGYYSHYHVPGHRWYREDGTIFEHFHVWFGDPL